MPPRYPSGRDAISMHGVRRSHALTALCGVVALTVLLGGCSAPALPLAGDNPAAASSPAPGVGYRSTTAGYRSQRPVDPAPWIEQNQRVAPNPGSKQ